MIDERLKYNSNTKSLQDRNSENFARQFNDGLPCSPSAKWGKIQGKYRAYGEMGDMEAMRAVDPRIHYKYKYMLKKDVKSRREFETFKLLLTQV
jgi:hypothetical protein